MKNNFWENLILLLILLVIVQTFLDDFARLVDWPVDARIALMITGFCFDLIFSFEFIIRLLFAYRKKNILHYIWFQRGWVDLISSIPLLLLNSGPQVYAYLFTTGVTGGAVGAFNIMKVIKAIRVARILRLMRAVKIFGKIHNTDSVMAQRHVGNISTLVVAAIVCVLITVNLINIPGVWPDTKSQLTEYRQQYYTHFQSLINTAGTSQTRINKFLHTFYHNDNNVLDIMYVNPHNGKKTICYSAPTTLFPLHIQNTITSIPEYKKRYFNKALFDDYTDDITVGQYTMTLSNKPIWYRASRINITLFAAVIVSLIFLLVLYTAHFARTVSDPIHIMYRGMILDHYNLEVKIIDAYKADEVFELAKDYNETWLPMKAQRLINKRKTTTSLSMDDILKIQK